MKTTAQQFIPALLFRTLNPGSSESSPRFDVSMLRLIAPESGKAKEILAFAVAAMLAVSAGIFAFSGSASPVTAKSATQQQAL